MPEPILLGAIADDHTGATDLCNTLTREGMRAVQTIGVQRGLDLPETDVVVVALKSRTAPVAHAVAESRAALAWLRELGARQFFFKICSTFDSTPDGNIGPVADALLDELGADFAVVCPAFPANRRTVYRGHLFVGDRLLSESPMARHPLTPMTDPDLVRFLGLQTPRRVGLVPLEAVRARCIEARFDALRKEGVTYAIADAVEDDDLRAIGAASARLPLLIGGSALGLRLPSNFGLRRRDDAAASRVDGPAVVLAGSCSSATIEQVARMAERYPSFKVNVPGDGAEAVPAAALPHLADGAVLVYTTAPPDEVRRSEAHVAEAILAGVAQHAVAAGARRIVVAGGETSGAVMQALGVRALAVGDEIAPGVPWMTAIGDPPLALALKSGNFGGPDFFLEAVA
jgi:uncharacterized protein YgbK (DUF1537 family)